MVADPDRATKKPPNQNNDPRFAVVGKKNHQNLLQMVVEKIGFLYDSDRIGKKHH